MSELFKNIMGKTAAEVHEPVDIPSGTWELKFRSIKSGDEIEGKDGKTWQKCRLYFAAVRPAELDDGAVDVSPVELEVFEEAGGVSTMRPLSADVLFESEKDGEWEILRRFIDMGLATKDDPRTLDKIAEEAKGATVIGFVKHRSYTSDGEERTAVEVSKLAPIG